MYSDIILVLEREFDKVNDSIQEKLSPGELYVTLGKPTLGPMAVESYEIEWMYDINFKHIDPRNVEETIKKIINTLEEGYSEGRFMVIDVNVDMGRGNYYLCTVTFTVTEEIIIT